MRYRDHGIRSRAATAALLATLAFSAALPAAAPTDKPDAEAAVWTTKQLRFVYMGFTAHYSCDGLADKVQQVLVSLGARDVHVTPSGCASPYGSPDPFPGVSVKMSVLEPAAETAGSKGREPVAAHWQAVDLTAANDLQTAGACELYEQIHARILPKFATRNVDYNSSCVPHQLEPGAIRLRAEVLMPNGAPAAASAAAHRAN